MRVVLDTNILVSALLVQLGHPAPIQATQVVSARDFAASFV
jgi:predicted nucleic acid-binding protein